MTSVRYESDLNFRSDRTEGDRYFFDLILSMTGSVLESSSDRSRVGNGPNRAEYRVCSARFGGPNWRICSARWDQGLFGSVRVGSGSAQIVRGLYVTHKSPFWAYLTSICVLQNAIWRAELNKWIVRFGLFQEVSVRDWFGSAHSSKKLFGVGSARLFGICSARFQPWTDQYLLETRPTREPVGNRC
jgi:hypothetical protein